MGWIYMVNSRLWLFKFKSSLCWEQLNHTKNDQLSIIKLGWVLCEICLLLPLERMIDMKLNGFVVVIYSLGI